MFCSMSAKLNDWTILNQTSQERKAIILSETLKRVGITRFHFSSRPGCAGQITCLHASVTGSWLKRCLVFSETRDDGFADDQWDGVQNLLSLTFCLCPGPDHSEAD
jgi:hypothetical protein